MITLQSRLSQLVDVWYNVHGKTLKDHRYRYSRLLALCERLGNPCLCDFETRHFSEYRVVRLTEVSVSTVNHEMRYLRAVFNEMSRLGYYDGDNPVASIRALRENSREMGYLELNQIPILLDACAESENPYLTTVVKICLSTGSRFGEAEYLTKNGLMRTSQPKLKFMDTKNGKTRVLPISQQLMSEILLIGNAPCKRRMFENCRDAFRSAAKRSAIEFPPGQKTHILRHTFASHFMMQGGDILTLQKILGHSDLKMTMRYAHLSPDYLNKVLELNPLSRVNVSYSPVFGFSG